VSEVSILLLDMVVTTSFANYASTFVRRVKTGGASLQDDLALITDSGSLDIPEERFTIAIQESREESGRKAIMTHVHQCLRDGTKPKAWKRLNSAMILVEQLLKFGSPALIAEIAVGRHFDIVQKLSLVERFQHTTNERAQTIVRSRAKVLKTSLLRRLETFAAKSGDKNVDYDNETESTCSPKGSVAESTTSFESAASVDKSVKCDYFDFEDLVEWAEDGEDDSCEYWFA